MIIFNYTKDGMPVSDYDASNFVDNTMEKYRNNTNDVMINVSTANVISNVQLKLLQHSILITEVAVQYEGKIIPYHNFGFLTHHRYNMINGDLNSKNLKTLSHVSKWFEEVGMDVNAKLLNILRDKMALFINNEMGTNYDFLIIENENNSPRVTFKTKHLKVESFKSYSFLEGNEKDIYLFLDFQLNQKTTYWVTAGLACIKDNGATEYYDLLDKDNKNISTLSYNISTGKCFR
jgi:hypothetical protein